MLMIAHGYRSLMIADRLLRWSLTPADDCSWVQVVALSRKCNRFLYEACGAQDGGAYFRLFRTIDHNRSGRIDFGEYTEAVREVLGCSQSELP